MRRVRAIAAVVAAAGVAAALVLAAGAGAEARASQTFRWDIASVDFTSRPPVWSPGGTASAVAGDGSRIELTGSGTFGGPPASVTGGGAWTAFDARGEVVGRGTYRVEALVGFFGAPGSFTGRDAIGAAADARAGLAVLRVRYSDGARGTLEISAHVPGTPRTVSQGIAATKGYVSYRERSAPVPNVDANRTLFHVRG